jgi:hypothetical protein
MNYRFLLLRDKLLLLTLFALFYAYSSPVRVAVRALLEGSQFSWSYPLGVRLDGEIAAASGKGLFGHTSYILFVAFAILWLLCAGLRRPDGWFRGALAGWTSIGFGVDVWLTAELGDGLTSNKTTLGLSNLSYLWTEVVPAGAAWFLAMALLTRGWFRGSAAAQGAPWRRINTMFGLAAAGFLLLAAVLLNMGPQHGPADFNGIGMMYLAFLLALLSLSPWERREANGERKSHRTAAGDRQPLVPVAERQN